jgi:sugar-specific transcriptional regulator TrmB
MTSQNTQLDLLKLNDRQPRSVVGLEGVEVLVSLGLTGRQARVYLALLKAGSARAQVIAGLALVHRQEIYHLVESLKQLGLVQQNVSVPTSYTATPIADGIKLLLEQKASEITLLSQKAERLTRKLSQTPHLAPTALAPEPCFGVVWEADRGKKYLKAIQGTQHTIDMVTSWTRFKKTCFMFETQLKDTLKRDVTLRIVDEKPTNHQLPRWVRTALPKYAAFELKIVPNPPSTAITIFDGTQAAVAFNPNVRFTKGPEFWSVHPGLVAVCRGYFDGVWIGLE